MSRTANVTIRNMAGETFQIGLPITECDCGRIYYIHWLAYPEESLALVNKRPEAKYCPYCGRDNPEYLPGVEN